MVKSTESGYTIANEYPVDHRGLTYTSDDWSHLPEALREPESRTRTTTSHEDEDQDEVPVVVTVFVLVRRGRARARLLLQGPAMLREDVTNRQYGYIGIKRLGAGQMYLITIRDKDGNALHGKNQYRLHVPPDAPVKQYWSVTAYDRGTHALIRGMSRASRSSQIPELQKNTDGSIDLYVGPKAPAGKESNWIPTDRARGFELMFRAYAPTPALLEKKWVLPDVEKVPTR